MEGDILKNFGEFGAFIKRYIDREIERKMKLEREIYALQIDEDEDPYDLSPQELADSLPMKISRDTIMHCHCRQNALQVQISGFQAGD